jgi:hypothetical protein
VIGPGDLLGLAVLAVVIGAYLGARRVRPLRILTKAANLARDETQIVRPVAMTQADRLLIRWRLDDGFWITHAEPYDRRRHRGWRRLCWVYRLFGGRAHVSRVDR